MYVATAAAILCGRSDLRRHIIAKHPTQPPDGIMTPAELWDDNRCRTIVGPMFDKIEHGPYKADICRLYVLYRYGGLYTDDDIYLLSEPTLQHLTVVQESAAFKSSSSHVGLFNAYIEVPQRYSPFIFNAIRMSVATINETRIVNTDTGTLWGPMILQRALKSAPKITVQEQCTSSPCDCHVPGMLLSHRPCRY